MVGHGYVHYVLGSPLRHVASDAVSSRRQHRSMRNCLMALLTDSHIHLDRFLPAGNIVWIVAGSTGHFAVQKAFRFAQSIRRVCNLKGVILRVLLAIEIYFIVLKRLPGTVR